MLVWFIAEDVKYFANQSWHKEYAVELLILPSEDIIIKAIREGKIFNVLSNMPPPAKLSNLFVIKKLLNEHYYLTSQEYAYLETLSENEKKNYLQQKLEEKLNLKIYRPNLNEQDLIGLQGVKRFIYRVKLIESEKLKAKGIFLVGVPGVGKSFSAKYASSLLNYYLVELNIAKIMQSDNAIELLHNIFSYLEIYTKTQGVVLWIDEIEKMFAGQNEPNTKRLFGQLLTILNDLNTPTGYQIKGIFWVTANNIKDIIENNPEFLRKGRFDELFFIDTPIIDYAKEMFKMYKTKYQFEYLSIEKKTFETDVVNVIGTVYSMEAFKHGAKDTAKFIYASAEIENITKELAIRYELKKKFNTLDEKDKNNLTALLYPKREFQHCLLYIKNLPYYSAEYERFIENVKGYLTKGNYAIDIADIANVVIKNDPLTIRLKDTIAYMRSQEKFFTSAD